MSVENPYERVQVDEGSDNDPLAFENTDSDAVNAYFEEAAQLMIGGHGEGITLGEGQKRLVGDVAIAVVGGYLDREEGWATVRDNLNNTIKQTVQDPVAAAELRNQARLTARYQQDRKQALSRREPEIRDAVDEDSSADYPTDAELGGRYINSRIPYGIREDGSIIYDAAEWRALGEQRNKGLDTTPPDTLKSD